MTRRNLADVLRQEVNKEDPETDPVPSQVARDVPSSTEPSGQSASCKASEVEGGSTQTAQAAQMAELKAALAQQTAQEKALQAQVKTLQTEVKRHQKEIARLEAQVSQGLQLEAELTEAKALILQLSEENTHLIEALDVLQKSKASALKASSHKTPLALRPLPTHSIQQGHPPRSNASNTVDVGWMD